MSISCDISDLVHSHPSFLTPTAPYFPLFPPGLSGTNALNGFASRGRASLRVLLLHGDASSGGLGIISNLNQLVRGLKDQCKRSEGCELAVVGEANFTSFCQQVRKQLEDGGGAGNTYCGRVVLSPPLYGRIFELPPSAPYPPVSPFLSLAHNPVPRIPSKLPQCLCDSL